MLNWVKSTGEQDDLEIVSSYSLGCGAESLIQVLALRAMHGLHRNRIQGFILIRHSSVITTPYLRIFRDCRATRSLHGFEFWPVFGACVWRSLGIDIWCPT